MYCRSFIQCLAVLVRLLHIGVNRLSSGIKDNSEHISQAFRLVSLKPYSRIHMIWDYSYITSAMRWVGRVRK